MRLGEAGLFQFSPTSTPPLEKEVSYVIKNSNWHAGKSAEIQYMYFPKDLFVVLTSLAILVREFSRLATCPTSAPYLCYIRPNVKERSGSGSAEPD